MGFLVQASVHTGVKQPKESVSLTKDVILTYENPWPHAYKVEQVLPPTPYLSLPLARKQQRQLDLTSTYYVLLLRPTTWLTNAAYTC